MARSADLKIIAEQRRQRRLVDVRDGLDYGTRWIPPKSQYKRNVKHRPQTVDDWEELED
jgi:hypothetical protein